MSIPSRRRIKIIIISDTRDYLVGSRLYDYKARVVFNATLNYVNLDLSFVNKVSVSLYSQVTSLSMGSRNLPPQTAHPEVLV